MLWFSLSPPGSLSAGVAKNTLNVPQLWLSIMLSVILCLLPAIGYQFLKPLLWPLSVDKVFDTIHGLRHPLTFPVRGKMKMTGFRRSAYAFSHKQGFGPLITSGMFMKAKRSRKGPYRR
ncbi:unnamed protein product [Pipistrellus nathusii]|uniref:Uncharacterized protein n=1 Tax=Pipistrellus nathusii TaxID=59473 RepID=A0ABN9Z674_PIPNA